MHPLPQDATHPTACCGAEAQRGRDAAYTPMLAELGITYPQYLVLMVLWEQDTQPVNDIAHRLLLETNTVTPLLQRMEKQGLVVHRCCVTLVSTRCG